MSRLAGTTHVNDTHTQMGSTTFDVIDLNGSNSSQHMKRARGVPSCAMASDL
jgi:hypothetical protein